MIPADLSVASDVDRLIASALEAYGHVDILVNNAAYTVGRALFTHVPT